MLISILLLLVLILSINNDIDVNAKKKYKVKTYKVYSDTGFKSYESATCITNTSSKQYKLKKKYKLGKGGVWTVKGRYCVALGSAYCSKIGTKVDLILKYRGKKKKLKCILADQKADSDTVEGHTRHSDGSVAEFIVNTNSVPRIAKYVHGDISYANKIFRGKIVAIKVYKKKKNK